MTFPSSLSRRLRALAISFAALSLPFQLAAQADSGAWRYKFRPGDHLVYTETVHRSVDGSSIQYETEARFTSQVLIVGAIPTGLAVGTQRNRQGARLISYKQNGKDRLTQELPKFAERLSHVPNQWSETNWFSNDGTPQLPWAAVRESSSRVLLGVHEIESLPETAVKAGDEWRSLNPLGLRFHYVRSEALNGHPCHIAEAGDGSNRLRYWFCPEPGAPAPSPSGSPEVGLISKVELDAAYLSFAGRVHETVTLELNEVRHNESLSSWLGSRDTRLAVLRASLVTASIPVPQPELNSLLTSDDADVQLFALTILQHRKLPIPTEPTAKLSSSPDPRIQHALRAAETTADPPCPSPASSNQRLMQVSGATLRYMESEPFRGSTYILRVPVNYRREGQGHPLIVYLSGGPGLAIDGANGAEETISKTDYIVLYPNAGGEMWWTRNQVNKVRALITEAIPKLNIDRNRVYLVGFSNGGTGALYYATLWPEQFSAVAPLMGAAACIDELRPLAWKKLTNVPVLLIHGDKDSIIPSSCSEDAYRELRKYSPASELHILKGREHEIVLGNDDGLTLPFLQNHPRCTITPAAK